MKWETQAINKKFLGLLKKNFEGRFTNYDAYQLYWNNCYTRKEETARWAARCDQDPYTFDTMMTMNVRNQLCVLAHHGFLRRIEPGVYDWQPTQMDNIAFWNRVDWVNTLVRSRKVERQMLYLEARIESERIKKETGKYVPSYEIFHKYLEEGK